MKINKLTKEQFVKAMNDNKNYYTTVIDTELFSEECLIFKLMYRYIDLVAKMICTEDWEFESFYDWFYNDFLNNDGDTPEEFWGSLENEEE